MDDIAYDLSVVRDAEVLGLSLNGSKSEIISNDLSVSEAILASLPGAQLVSPSRATLLGSPLGDLSSIDQCLEEKVESLQLMASRLQHLSSHDSLFLLRHSLSIPRLRYLLRTTPCFLSEVLTKYDKVLRETLGAITNVLTTLHGFKLASLSSLVVLAFAGHPF